MASIIYVLLVAVFCIADSMQTEYEPCAGGLPVPKSVNILGCTTLPCNLKRGGLADGQIQFTVLEKTETLTPKVDIHIGIIHTSYELPEQNACKSIVNGECPLDKGEVVTYQLKMPVEKTYPKIALTIQLSLVDDKGKAQTCLRIPARVVD